MTESITDQTRFVNAREIRIVGLSRSGNHAIINWILAQCEGRTCFLNCVEGKTNPFESARPLQDGSRFRVNYRSFDLEAERRGDFSRKDLLIFNHEDSFLGHACSDIFEREHDGWVGPSKRRHDVLILRDPYNLMASRRRARFTHASDRLVLRIWKQHARQFLEETQRLRAEPVLISYNRWCQERTYRRGIADRLGLQFCDAGRSQVAACAGGSSFDGLSYDGDASQMRVLSRWRHYADDPDFWRIFDDEVHAFAFRIFGDVSRRVQRVAEVA